MEKVNMYSTDWLGILMQWLFLFALVSIFFFPAFNFRNLAIEYNKKGWLYFLVGLAVGIVGFNLGQLAVFALRYVVPQEYFTYLSAVLFLSAYIFYRICYKFLKASFVK